MSKIKLAAGMAAKCLIKGNLTIESVLPHLSYPIMAKAEDEQSFVYLSDGSYERDMQPTLKLLNIPFTEGLEVECDLYGKGVVSLIDTGSPLPVMVFFESNYTETYTIDGRITRDANITLYPKYEI